VRHPAAAPASIWYLRANHVRRDMQNIGADPQENPGHQLAGFNGGPQFVLFGNLLRPASAYLPDSHGGGIGTFKVATRRQLLLHGFPKLPIPAGWEASHVCASG